MKKKKAAVVILILVVVLGVIAGGIFAYRGHRDKKKKVKVYPVSMINWGDSEEGSYSSGTVTDDKSQSIYLESDDVVAEVFVQEGDQVTEGTPLFRYDMEKENLNLEMKELSLSTAQNDLTIAQRELERLKATTPVTDTVPEPEEEQPQPQEPLNEKTGNAYNIVGMSAKAFEGEGTQEEPFRFLCTSQAYVTGEYLNYLREKSYTAVFEIHRENKIMGAVLSAWLVNGQSLEEEYAADEQWSVLNRSPVEEELPQEEEQEELPEEMEGYTAAELAGAIAEKEKEIRNLDIDKRKIELELEQLKKASGDGVVKAEVNGTATTVQNPADMVNDGSPFIEIRGQDSLYVTGALSELLLDDIKVGQKVLIDSWESGQRYEGTITEISNTPTDNESYGGESNPNVSYYPYTAEVEDSEGLRNGEGVEMRINQNESAGEVICLEKAFVRKENGKSYVMKEGKDKRLKKQYVKTGKTFYGQAIQILSGLSQEDYIAFPYGKEIKEGARVKESEELEY